MKNIVAFLLCLVAVLSLLSCQNPHDPIESDVETPPSSEGTPLQPTTDYGNMIELYRQAVDACSNYDGETSCESYAKRYGITDAQEKEFFGTFMYQTYSHYAGKGKADSLSPIYKLACGYAQKDLNGDGADELVLLTEDYTIFAIFSYVEEKPRVIGGLGHAFPDDRSYLENCWIDGDGFIYEYSEGAFEHKIKYKVAQGGASLETVAEYWLEERMEYEPEAHVVTEYYMLMGDEEIEITESEYKALDDQHGKYLGQYSGKEATKEHSGLEYVPLFSEAELIKDIYDSVLTTKTKVYEGGEYKFLKDVRTPYERKLLADETDLRYGFVDLDGDGIGEVVINCSGDKLVLRYYDRKVYLYPFTFRQMTYMNTDGSFSWTFTGEDHEYGSDKIYFEGEELKTKELWRVVNDGEINAECYIDGKLVSDMEIFEYFDANPEVKIEYLSMDESWNDRLSAEEAYETAIEYFGINDENKVTGATGDVIYWKLIVAAVPNEEDVYYHIISMSEYYQNLGDGTHSLIPHYRYINSELLVNSTTGECFETEIGTGCLAIENAEEYLGVNEWECEIVEGIKTVTKLEIADFAHCENPYYKVVLVREYYVHSEDAPEDTPPYKVETLKEIFVDARTDECMESIDKG